MATRHVSENTKPVFNFLLERDLFRFRVDLEHTNFMREDAILHVPLATKPGLRT